MRSGAFTLVVPPGALDRPVTLHITDVATPGTVDDGIAIAPAGHVFALPVRVTITFTPDVSPVSSELFVARFDDLGGWIPLEHRLQEAHQVSGDFTVAGTIALAHCPLGVCGHADPHHHGHDGHVAPHHVAPPHMPGDAGAIQLPLRPIIWGKISSQLRSCNWDGHSQSSCRVIASTAINADWCLF